MASIRRRRLAGGGERFDVHHRHDGRETTFTFPSRSEAETYAHLCNLRRRRWPLAPLIALVGLPPYQFAQRYGIARSTMHQVIQTGLSDIQADHWATAAGLHPAQVWGWDWVTAADPTLAHPEAGEAVA